MEEMFSSKVQKISNLANAGNLRVYSNEMSDCCTHMCRVCEKLVSLTGMRSHTKNSHLMPIGEYIETYGNYRTQLAREVYHKCGLCQEELLLDGDEIHTHSKRHKIMMKDYTAKFITKEHQKRRKVIENIKVEEKVVREKSTKIQKIVPKERGVWDTIQAIENFLDSFSRNFR